MAEKFEKCCKYKIELEGTKSFALFTNVARGELA